MAQTRQRLSQLGWRWRELATLWDVDEPADYARWTEWQRAQIQPPPVASDLEA
jgi:glycosyltransferase A (GT-A) superfamily protein (DUF2064 family)